MKWIQALRWQRLLNKIIKIKINEKKKKSGFDEQQIKNVFINAYIILKKGTAEPNKQRIKSF